MSRIRQLARTLRHRNGVFFRGAGFLGFRVVPPRHGNFSLLAKTQETVGNETAHRESNFADERQCILGRFRMRRFRLIGLLVSQSVRPIDDTLGT